jgi:hypothetical protein
MMTGFRHLTVLFVLLALTGCETVNGAMSDMKGAFSRLGGNKGAEAAAPATEEQPLIAARGVDCPRVGVVDDLNSITQLADGSALSSARMASIQSQCAINDTNVIVDMDIMFDGRMGPKGRAKPDDKPSFSYPYFIAITTPQGEITAKEVFTATVVYDAGQDVMEHAEQLRQVIPLTGEYNPRDFEVLVGFQLSPEELAYNRANPAAASTVRNLPPAPAAAAAPVDSVSAEMTAPPPAMAAPMAPPPAPAMMESQIPSPPPAADVPPMADEAYIPAPQAVMTESPQPQMEDVTPMQAVAPLYPPVVGQAPPPPVTPPTQKVVPRVDDDTKY